MKQNTKYNYQQGTRSTDHGTRIYDIGGYKLPSVTTILAKTKDQILFNGLEKKVGHEEAERIKNLI
jgi:hypothetical protein